MRMSPDFASEKDQLCFPTHQVFELPLAPHTPPSPVSPTLPDYQRLVLSPSATLALYITRCPLQKSRAPLAIGSVPKTLYLRT
jgi:hypothetical protein